MKLKISIIVILVFHAISAFPQMVGILEDDARIVRGTMPNGLSYYLVHNSSVKGYADFAFIQQNGVAMEDSSSRGMTYLMECMALTETANFPDGAIFTFIDNMGLSRADGLVIDAGDYYTTYAFSNVPVSKNASMVDSMLLAIYNMSSALVVDERSVERGKSFFRNVFSARQTLEQRIKDSLARYYFAGTPLAPVRQEELFRLVDNYSVGDVAQFYRTRCRPDMQAIVVAGDIDVKAVESKIRALFQVVPKPDTPLPEFPDSVLQAAEGGYFYFRDPEADRAGVNFYYMADPLDRSLKNTAVPFIYNYLSGVGMDIMNRRLQRALEKAPFYAVAAGAEMVPYLNRMAFRLYVECAPENYTEAYGIILGEVGRLMDYGVSGKEFMESSGDFIFRLNETYSRRSSLDNEYYRSLCVANFTDNNVMAGIELYKSYIETAAQKVDSSTVYRFLSSVFSDDSSRTVVCWSPEHTGGLEYFAVERGPLEDEYLKCPESVSAEVRGRAGQNLFVNKSTGVMSRRLANGANVACRKMDVEPGWVYFEAVARGGVSLAGDSLAVLRKYINDVARISVNGGMNMFELQRLKESLRITLERDISVGSRRISGRFPSDRIDEFVSLVSMYFKGSAPDYDTFGKFRSMRMACAPYKYNSPERVFDRLSNKDIRSVSGNVVDEDPSVEGLDYDMALNFVNELFSNAADFSFIFLGDFEERELMESVDAALAGLNGQRTGQGRAENRTFFIASYDDMEEVEVPMAFPRRLHSCKITIPSYQKVGDRVLSEVTAKIIEREVIRRLSLHGILADASRRFYRFPEEVLTIDFRFSTYGGTEDLEGLFAGIVMDLAGTGVSAGEVEGVKNNMLLSDALMEARDYDYWKLMLRNRYVERKDFYTGRKAALEAVTVEDVNESLYNVLDKGRISLLSVVPAAGKNEK